MPRDRGFNPTDIVCYVDDILVTGSSDKEKVGMGVYKAWGLPPP